MAGEGFQLGFSAGSALGGAVANGVAEWKQIQRDRQERKEFDGAMGLAAQRRAMVRSAAQVEEAQILEQLKSQVQRYPNAQQADRPTGNVREDGSPETEQVIRTPEGDIPIQQILMLKQRKQQAESNAELAEVDLIMELQARYPENRYVKQWVASTYAGIQQKQQIRSKQVEAQRLQLDTIAAGLEQRKFQQQLQAYQDEPQREERKAATENALGMQRDAARIEAERRSQISVAGEKARLEGQAPAKPPTVEQSKAATFGKLAEQALTELDSLDYDRTATASRVESALPNEAKSEGLQRVEQAERNFLAAVLRKKSGALISPSEFASGEVQYFPRPGDKPQTVAQKARNRALEIETLKGEAGAAWNTPASVGEGAAPPAGGLSAEEQALIQAVKAGQMTPDEARKRRAALRGG